MRNKTEQILRVAAKLIAKKGYGEASFQEIADIVKLHKSTLFHYFKTKEELLLSILEKPIQASALDLEKIVNDTELEPEEKLRKAIGNHLRTVIANMDTVTIFLNEIRNLSRKNKSLYMERRKHYQREFMKIIVEMKSKGHFNTLDPNIVTLAILGMLNWVVKWYKKSGAYSLDEISDIFYRLITPLDKGSLSLLCRKDRVAGKSS